MSPHDDEGRTAMTSTHHAASQAPDTAHGQPALDGLHHITATTGDARANVDFYTRVLGLRLIAKSVNQDDPTHYHLFFGDELARPGSDLTFFEYRGTRQGRAGAGMVHQIVWRVEDEAALAFWQQRLADEGVAAIVRDTGSLRFADPEGLDHELVLRSVDDPPISAVHPEIPSEHALQGFEGVRAYSHAPHLSEDLLVELLGATRREDGALELRNGRRGGWIAFDPAPAEPGIQGAGAVHHVAFATRDHEQDDWLRALAAARIPNSGHVDRHYFRSLYFREPGGILYELATEGPGFTVDGPVESLGTRVILPPFLEPHRQVIEPQLTPLPDARADWPAQALARAGEVHDGAASDANTGSDS
jgi:glyoxalase family protein